MQIVYCHACGLRIPERDLAQNLVVRVEENKIFCLKCAPDTSAKKRKLGSKLISATEIPARASTPSLPSVPVHDVRRPTATHSPAHPQEKPANNTPIIAAAAAVVLLLAFVFVGTGTEKKKEKPIAAAPQPLRTPSNPATSRETVLEHPRDVNPPVASRANPETETHIPVTGPIAIKKDDPENQAGDAFEKMRKFEGLEAGDKPGRIKRLEEFAASWTDTLAASRARAMIDELRKADAPSSVASTPSTAAAPANAVASIDKTDFASAFNYALAANGATASGAPSAGLLIDGNFTNYDGGLGFAYSKQELPASFTVSLKEPVTLNCIRILLWDHDERFYRYKLEACADDSEKTWTMLADKTDEASKCQSWQVLRFAPCTVKLIKLTGTYSINNQFHVVELQAFNLGENAADLEFNRAMNYALATNGATAKGSASAGKLIDGNSTSYRDHNGYAMFHGMPQAFTVTLKDAVDLNCIRFLLWDLDDRFYRYKLDVCPDDAEKEWISIADKSDDASKCRSWQVIRFDKRKVKHIRLTGTYSSSPAYPLDFHVVELQAFNLVPASEQPKPAVTETALLSETFDGPTCDGLFFGVQGDGPPGSNGKVLILKGTNNCAKGAIASWALKPGWTRKGEFPVNESTRIRFRYYNGNARHFGFHIRVIGEEKQFLRDLPAEPKNSWLTADFAVSDLPQLDTGNKVKAGSVLHEILFETWGNTDVNAYVDDFWIGNVVAAPPAPPKPDVASPAKGERWNSYDDFLEDLRAALHKHDRTEAAALLKAAAAVPAVKSRRADLDQDAKALDWLNDLDAAVTAGAEKLKDVDLFELHPDKDIVTVGKRGKFQVSEIKDGVIYASNNDARLPIALSALDPENRQQLATLGLENDGRGNLLRAFIALLNLERKSPAFQLSAVRTAIDKALSGNAPPEVASIKRHFDQFVARQADAEKAQATSSRLEIDAMRELAAINSLLDSAKWEQAEAALTAFKQKYSTTTFATKKAEDIKGTEVRCIEGPLAKGLVAYWKFDEGRGTTAIDATGHGSNGTITGCEWVPGISGTGLSFNGNDDYVEVADNPRLHLTDALTISVWFKNTGTSRHWARLLSKGWFRREVPFVAYALYLDDGPEGNQKYRLHVNQGKDKENGLLSNSVDGLNQWHHIAAVFDSANSKMMIYVDGVKEAEAPTPHPGIAATTGYLRIGDDVHTHEKIKGIIDEVRLYNRPLTDAEIKAIFTIKK